MKITNDSHVDHGLTPAQVDYLSKRFADRKAFFIESIDLPEDLGTVPCGLYGPIMGDAPVPEAEVVYQKRGARKHESRMVKRPLRPCRTVTVVAGPHNGEACVLYTAFGGPRTPKEPRDETVTPEERDFCTKVWAEHALALE